MLKKITKILISFLFLAVVLFAMIFYKNVQTINPKENATIEKFRQQLASTKKSTVVKSVNPSQAQK